MQTRALLLRPFRAARVFLLASLVVALAIAGGASRALAQAFQTLAPEAILIDAATGTVLFEKAADELISPASMAKLMTVAVIYDEMQKGRLNPDSEFQISENAWRKGGGGGGGSSMFAQLNSKVKLSDLLRGIIIQSGNDASIAAAEGIAGTEENFARMMNDRAKALGLTRSTFRNSTGYSAPDQKSTVRDLAKLSLHLIETYPEQYKMFAEREFTWNKIRQQNRNPLLTMDMGADGLKTGFLEESGYGLAASAIQNGQRLVLVVSGLKTARDRANETRKMLDWGFRAFESRQLFEQGQPVGEVAVFGGAKGSLPLVAKRPVRVLLPRGSSDRLTAQIVYNGPVRAPLEQGAQVGKLRVMRGDVQALEMPLYAGEAVPQGSITQRAVDGLMELGTGFIRKTFSRG
ncbi:MAG TPA: D-alanyl-D-alanine carboxypeptidase family protein [Beijerinckiaceae bacterium]|jgi:D-alanyl-D-alanine carboxypeptidase (penicillin-binding protein 5/6)